MVLTSWHDFSKQDLCHGGQLLSRFSLKANAVLPCFARGSISQSAARCNINIVSFQYVITFGKVLFSLIQQH